MEQRYSRLERYAPLGRVLPRWQSANVAVVGCGGLGGGLILQLARMGVSSGGVPAAGLVGAEQCSAQQRAAPHQVLDSAMTNGGKDAAATEPNPSNGLNIARPLFRLIDRDTVGPENLGHQALFTEADAAAGLPKAVAAAHAVAAINSAVRVEAVVASLDRRNIRELLAGVDLIFDGLDSYATRFLLNDYALTSGTPYLYAGVVRGELSARAIVPGVTGCLRCLLDAPPGPGEVPTCAAEGVFPPLLGVANMLQIEAANRILAGEFRVEDDVLHSLRLDGRRRESGVRSPESGVKNEREEGLAGPPCSSTFDSRLRTPDFLNFRSIPLHGPSASCPACAGRYDYLDGLAGPASAHACAPDRVELELAAPLVSLARAEALLAASGGFELKRNAWCLTAEAADRRYTVFASGRLALSGSNDPLELERFAATYLGI